MGCHAGLDISDAEVSVSGVPTPVDDWAKTFADSGALWVANTGYGYADTDTIAYSAKLMADFAGNLGSLTVGEALTAAKQQYAAGNAILSPYDLKALMESTFYGLPMYRLNSPTGRLTPPPGPATSTDPVTGLTIAPVSLSPSTTARQQCSQRQLLPSHRYAEAEPRRPSTARSSLSSLCRRPSRTSSRTAHSSPVSARPTPPTSSRPTPCRQRVRPTPARRRSATPRSRARCSAWRPTGLSQLRHLTSGAARPRGGPVLPQPELDDRRRHPAPLHLDAGGRLLPPALTARS